MTAKASTTSEVYQVVTPVFDVAMGERLRLMRMKQGLDQGDLAQLLGVSQSIVSRLERGQGKTCESPFSVARMQEVFGKDTLFILLGLNPERFSERAIGQKYWSKRNKQNKGKGRGAVTWAKGCR